MAKSFGKWLAEKREGAGLTQAELATAVGLSATYISALEREEINTKDGKPRIPRLNKIDKFARPLKVKVDEVRLAAGYAPEVQVDGLAAIGFSELSDADQEKVKEYITLLRMKNNEPRVSATKGKNSVV